MKPHPRIRKTIKWGGAAVTVLLGVVWIGSGWWMVQWSSADHVMVGCVAGRLDLADKRGNYQYLSRYNWRVYRGEFHLELGFDSIFFHPHGWHVLVPLWCPLFGSGTLTVVAWRLDALARRRARVGYCPKCNYDRAGLGVGAKCPECGMDAANPA